MPANVISDTFTGASADVTSRAADTGGTWTQDSVQNRAIYLNGSGKAWTASTVTQTSPDNWVYSSETLDPSVTTTGRLYLNPGSYSANPNINVGNHHAFVGLRWNPTSRVGYIARYVQGQYFSDDMKVELYRRNVGSTGHGTLLASAVVQSASSGNFNQPVINGELYLSVSGTGSTVSLTVRYAGTTYITYSDTSANRIVSDGRLLWGVTDWDYQPGTNMLADYVAADGTVITPVVYTETSSLAGASVINFADTYTTPFIESGALDNATVLSGADQFGFGYSETGLMDEASVLSGTDEFVTGYPEVGSIGASVTLSGVDSYTQSYVDTSNLILSAQLGQVTSGAQGGLAFLFTGGGVPADTYSTTLTYAETSTLNGISITSSTNAFNVYDETGTLLYATVFSGVDNFYSVTDLYQEFSTLSFSGGSSGLDSFPWIETGALGGQSTIAGSDTYGNHLFAEMVAYVTVDTEFGPKLVTKDFSKDIRVKPRVRHNLFIVDMEVNVNVQPKLSKIPYVAAPQKTHRMRERQSVHVI